MQRTTSEYDTLKCRESADIGGAIENRKKKQKLKHTGKSYNGKYWDGKKLDEKNCSQIGKNSKMQKSFGKEYETKNQIGGKSLFRFFSANNISII